MDINQPARKRAPAFIWVLYATAFLVSPFPALAAGEFKNIALPSGISLDIPSHWQVISRETRQNLLAAGAAIASSAGIEKTDGVKSTLLAVNAVPSPTGATIRVSITTHPEFTAADLSVVTASDLNQAGKILLADFEKLEKRGGPHIVSMTTPSVATLSGHSALVISYIRNSPTNTSTQWHVVQYRTPLADCLVEVTLSWRKGDEIIWRPILEHVLDSLKF